MNYEDYIAYFEAKGFEGGQAEALALIAVMDEEEIYGEVV